MPSRTATLSWNNETQGTAASRYVGWVPEETCGYRSPPHERKAGYEVLADAMYRLHETLMPYVDRLT